jgi:uncharacterized membrane protein
VLDRHFRHWRERGLLTAEQEAALRTASAELKEERGSRVVPAALAALGGGLVLAGLVLVIAENWDALHRAVKLGGWALLLVLFLVGAERVARRHPERGYLAEALAFVAGGWMMAGIALVSQIYHLDSRPANGIWLWLALVLPAAWVLRRRSVTAVIFTALVAGLGFEVATGDSWVHATTAEGPWLWLAIPLLAAVLVSWLPARWRGLTGWVGAWFFLAGNFFLLVFGSSHDLDRSDLGAAWVVAGAGLAAALALPERALPASWNPTAARLVLATTFLPWVLLGARFEVGDAFDLVAVGVAWLAQLAVAVLVIWSGARAGSKLWINFGYLAVLAGIVTRYFDLFGNYLRGGAALALTGVLILFVLFALERARRRTVQRGAPA